MRETNYDESKVGSYELPPLLVCNDGSNVATAFDWVNKRRREILNILKKELFGELPPMPDTFRKELVSCKEDALNGTAIRKEIRLKFSHNGKDHSFLMLLYIPKNAENPAPVFLGLNFKGNHTTSTEKDITISGTLPDGTVYDTEKDPDQSRRWLFEETIKRGYASATVFFNEITPDDKSPDSWRKGIWNLFYSHETDDEFHTHSGSISAWAWGLSRMMDALEEEPLVDATRAIVHGHSRLGKTSLWAGATDPRFKLVITNDSGCCGAALQRRIFGETIEVVNHNFPQWFVSSLKNYNCQEDKLPFDQHWLVALSAPRPVCIASATEDLWADPKGEFLSGLHASEVYRLFGVQGMPVSEMPGPDQPVTGEVSYHLRTGVHDQILADWEHYWKLADKFVRG